MNLDKIEERLAGKITPSEWKWRENWDGDYATSHLLNLKLYVKDMDGDAWVWDVTFKDDKDRPIIVQGYGVCAEDCQIEAKKWAVKYLLGRPIPTDMIYSDLYTEYCKQVRAA